MTIASTRVRIVGSVQLHSDQSVMLVSMSERIPCNGIQTEGGRVSSPGAEFGGMAFSVLRTSSCMTVWKPARLSESECCGGRPWSGKKACRSTCTLYSKLVAPLTVVSNTGSLKSAFLTVYESEDGLVLSTTIFQGSWVAFRIARRIAFLTS